MTRTNGEQQSGGAPDAEMQRIARTVLQAHNAMDQAWEMLKQINAESEHPGVVACAAGCGSCCSYLVDAVSSECAVIAASIEYGDPSYKAAVMVRLMDWESEFARWTRSHPIPNGGVKDHEHDMWRAGWQVRRIACPFLDLSNNCCTIYEDRPATCRGHHACYPPPELRGTVSEPPEGCFTKIEDVREGHMTPIWTLNSTLCQNFAQMLVDSLNARHIEWISHLLPILVLHEGRNRFGWPNPNPHQRRAMPPKIRVARREPGDGEH
jgi:Fe-S-cluster containining protein